MTFKELKIIDPILKALESEGYTNPTPIQEQAIPILLQHKDLLGCAQTGTGKTAAFAVPILQHLYNDRSRDKKYREIKSLIVTPTRELAIQIGESFKAYGRHTDIRNTVIYGGVRQGNQTQALKRGVDILIATPGRLLDLIDQGFVKLDKVEYFVLDEADRMLDMGFIHDIRRLIKLLPTRRQSLFFSATMPHDIVKLSQKILGNPEKVTVQPEQTTAEKVDQAVYFVDKKGKSKLLIHLLQHDAVYSALVFSRTKHGADKIVRMLSKSGIEAHALHGNKSQGQRQKALGNFKNGRINVLVATDIAARGIDVDELSHVINFDLPNMPETYVHRIGRTGRAGASGTALSFCDSDEKAYLRDIQKLIGQKIPVIADHPFINGTSGGSDETELNHGKSRATQQNRQNGNGSNSNGSYNGKRKPGSRKSRNKRRFNTSRKASFSSRG